MIATTAIRCVINVWSVVWIGCVMKSAVVMMRKEEEEKKKGCSRRLFIYSSQNALARLFLPFSHGDHELDSGKVRFTQCGQH